MPAAWVGAAAAAYTAVNSGSPGGGSSSGSGGGAPPAYIPTNQAGMDTNFQNNYNQYQTSNNGYYGLTNPYNQQLLTSQFSNPYNARMMMGSMMSGDQYGNTSDQAVAGGKNAFQNANNTAQWANQTGANLQGNAGTINNAFSGMNNLAQQSNRTYEDLIAQQQGQQGNVQRTVNNLTDLSGNAAQTGQMLQNYQMGQLGNVQNASNNLYGAAQAIGNTAFDPQNALYAQQQQKLVDGTRAAEYARGIQMSPYGAAIEADALGNFQNNWQNQQLARQSQGISAMQGADQSALGLGNSITSNIGSLQGQTIGNVAGAGTAAQNLNQNYLNEIASLTHGMGQDYGNLSGSAANLLEGYGQTQASVANTFGNAINGGYQGAVGLGNTAAQMQNAAGMAPYSANQMQYANQNQALGNYSNNNLPYLSGLNQLQSNSLGYMNFGAGAQNLGYQQNVNNGLLSNMYTQQAMPGISKGIQALSSAWNTGQPNGTLAGQNVWDVNGSSAGNSGTAGYGGGNNAYYGEY